MSNLNQFSNSLLKINVQQVLGSVDDLNSAEQSAAFQADTVAIAIGSFSKSTTPTSVHFSIGSNPTATDSMVVMPHVGCTTSMNNMPMTSYLIIGVNAGEKISCIRSSGYSMNAHIIELKY